MFPSRTVSREMVQKAYKGASRSETLIAILSPLGNERDVHHNVKDGHNFREDINEDRASPLPGAWLRWVRCSSLRPDGTGSG